MKKTKEALKKEFENSHPVPGKLKLSNKIIDDFLSIVRM